MTIDDKIAKLDKECPLKPFTRSSMIFSSVRRMKAEKEMNIPIAHRSGFACSVKTGKAANKMAKREWESFYSGLCGQLNREYPDLYFSLFPKPHRTPDEQRLIDYMEKSEGRPLTEQEKNLSIDQAYSFGELQDHSQRTPDQQSVVDVVARSRGTEWAEEHANSIIAEAEAYGCIDQSQPERKKIG